MATRHQITTQISCFLAAAALPLLHLSAGCSSDESSSQGGGPTVTGGSDAQAGGDGSSTTPPGPIEAVHFIGRFDRTDPAAPRFAWPGTGILARVRGTRIDVRLKDPGGENRFAVVVDGKAPTVIKTGPAAESYAIATGLPDGEHDVAIYKRTETEFGTVQFLGFVQPLVDTPSPYARKIEFVGDSITTGYGIDIEADFNCDVATDEDAYASYASIASRAAKAASSLVAWEGRGMYRNFDGSMDGLMPQLWPRTLGDQASSKWDFSSWIADVVVVHLGTNDWVAGDPGQPFSDAYAAFLGQVRSRYPNAWVLCALSPMLSGSDRDGARQRINGVVNAVKSRGDAKVAFVEFAQQIDTDGNGCAGHPSDVTHRKMADVLAAALRSTIGW